MKGLLLRACAFNVSAPGQNTDILSSDLSVKEACTVNVTVALSTGSVFNVVISDGTNSHTIGLGSGALDADEIHNLSFQIAPAESNSGSDNDLSFNFQVATDSVIELLVVSEAQLGAPIGLGQ